MPLHQINVDDTLSLVGCNMNLWLYEAEGHFPCLHARKVSFTSILISLHTYSIHPIIRSLNKLIPTTHCDTTVVQQHFALVHHHEPVHDLGEGPDQLPNTLFHPELLAS